MQSAKGVAVGEKIRAGKEDGVHDRDSSVYQDGASAPGSS